ncbi:hypothetical protein CAXC1_80035 [Candidatus Xenohaliotis californiensis]|uniref:Uncharacterized protein n=1 Tax=Candidatus Xenohaliotis californiensis TaxID=84677 RepID=A0ABM9N9H8_9RICK|nr:hypothetical protein CAXC1_80035 [Candidatus Xenohaliotis californiensis]
MARVQPIKDYSSHSVSVWDSLKHYTKGTANRVPNIVNDALIHALCASDGYRTTGDIHLSRADIKMNLLTSGFLRTLNERILSPRHYNNFEFRWIRHQGMIRLSLLYYKNKRSMPKIVPGKYIANMPGFDFTGYKKLLHKMEKSASFLYLGAKQRELETGTPVLTFKASRIDFIKPYVKSRLASEFAYRHIYDRVSDVAHVDKLRTNIARFIFYTPLLLIPLIGWLIIYISEKYNAMNDVSAFFGPYSTQLYVAENFANMYSAMQPDNKARYNAITRIQLSDLESPSDEELRYINEELYGNKTADSAAMESRNRTRVDSYGASYDKRAADLSVHSVRDKPRDSAKEIGRLRERKMHVATNRYNNAAKHDFYSDKYPNEVLSKGEYIDVDKNTQKIRRNNRNE